VHEASTRLQLNDISVCTLALSRPLVLDAYRESRDLGSFILVAGAFFVVRSKR